MNTETPDSVVRSEGRSQRFHRWRARKDSLARWIIAIGGIGVIAAVGLIFFYLLWVIFPLFTPAAVEIHSAGGDAYGYDRRPVWLSLEEQVEVAFRISGDGTASFYEVENGREISTTQLPSGEQDIVKAAAEAGKPELIAFASSGGEIFVAIHSYAMDFSSGVSNRSVVPSLEFPFGAGPLFAAPGIVADLAVAEDERQLILATLGEDGKLGVFRAEKQTNLLTGETSLDSDSKFRLLSFDATALAISGDGKTVYVGDTQGFVHSFDRDRLEHLRSLQLSETAITELTMLLGGVSVLAGDSSGGIAQAFPVRGENNQFELTRVRDFPGQGAAVDRIEPESRRKGFVVLDAAGVLGIYHSTTAKRVLEIPLASPPAAIALAPRANAVLVEGAGGAVSLLEIDNPHPDVSWATLWRKVWYENYPEPQFVWQSSAANTDFEPKFSLTPLVFGTLKAALYAMLFAVPLALMAAAYTAYFLAPNVREAVKPTIETMAALPTVVLGFLAGLWFAPFVEQHLAGMIMIVLFAPAGVLVFAWVWHQYQGRIKQSVPEGCEPLLLIPVMIASGFIAMWLADPVQSLFFGGDLRNWLTHEAGIDYDQRNALIVGCAMGFAVIPTIFSIAEDAFYGVPRGLSMGSLALGATPWQTMVRVILPTASPGIFSALMIGLGRAIGETMIVLMATGNTPIMDWNIFEGMRTLAANIAVEMPESAVGSSHYRVLFLAALVLFVFTFVVNTGAEVVRQRLREKYSSL